MRALHGSCFLVATFALVSCTDGPKGEPPLDPAPPAGGQQLATDTFKLQPGQETYMCYQFYSPADAPVAITRVDEISMPGIHHFGLFQAFGRNEPDAPHECLTLIKQTWLPIWGSNTGQHTLEMPAGTGFIIQPGTQYIIQLHLQNVSDNVLEIRGGVNLTYERNTDAVIPAGMYALGSEAINIPPATTDYQLPVSCAPSKDMNVFGVLPHMHKLGTKLEVTQTPMGGTASTFYKIDPWVFGNQPLDMYNAHVAPTDQFQLTCHYTNNLDHAVTYGESSDDEMCFFVMFYYPYDHLDGCITSG
jgi:hypothetical protein